ncbi:hypothetical protein ZWY2020_050426 [Hordeum vulgare]|nr:hypothetical protein ZWY2020_050426 [Hordeum vulgare]
MAEGFSWCWPWLSSGAAWFIFFNVVVGAVAVLSWAQQGGDAEVSRRRRLTRSASSMVMERLRSMSVFAAFHSVPEHDYGGGGGLTPPASPSRLHHVREYYTSTSSREEGGEAVGHVVQPEPALPATMATSTPAAAEARSAASMPGSDDEAVAQTRTEMSGCLEDACAVAGQPRDELAAPEPTPATAAAMERPRKREPAVKVVQTVWRRAYAEVEEKAEVNARAERFIRQFREDLKLERIKSILNRGCAAAASAR